VRKKQSAPSRTRT